MTPGETGAIVAIGAVITAALGFVAANNKTHIRNLEKSGQDASINIAKALKDLSDKIAEVEKRSGTFFRNRDELFLSSLEQQNKQSASETAAIVTVLQSVSQNLNVGHQVSVDTFNIVNAGKGWNEKLDKIMIDIGQVKIEMRSLVEIRSKQMEIKDSVKDIAADLKRHDQAMAECRGILKNNYGNRTGDK